jgi:hypothetical protein
MLSMSLAASGFKFKGGEDEDGGLGIKESCFFPGALDLDFVEQAEFGAKGENHALGLCSLGFGVGMEPSGAGQWLDAGEVDVVAAFAAQAGLEEFVAPFGVAEGGAFARDRRVEEWSGGVAKVGDGLLRDSLSFSR